MPKLKLTRSTSLTKTVGVAPKVLTPALTLVGVGAVLVVVGVLLDDDTLRTLGYATLGSALTGVGVGYVAPPADHVTAVPVGRVDAASDDGLPEPFSEGGEIPPAGGSSS